MSVAPVTVSYVTSDLMDGDLITITIQLPQPWAGQETYEIAASCALSVTDTLRKRITRVFLKPSA
jgi:hypothetical protein